MYVSKVIMIILELKEVRTIRGVVAVKAGQANIRLIQVLLVIRRYQEEKVNITKCTLKQKLLEIEN